MGIKKKELQVNFGQKNMNYTSFYDLDMTKMMFLGMKKGKQQTAENQIFSLKTLKIDKSGPRLPISTEISSKVLW